jgi:DNA-binding XRE family transcriptional regulator
MEENRSALAAAVREARTRLGMTQNQLADAAGVARATLQALERGDAVRPASVIKVEPVLGWPGGTGQTILRGEAAPAGVAAGAPLSLASLSESDLVRAISAALVAVADSLTAAEIREISQAAAAELKRGERA